MSLNNNPWEGIVDFSVDVQKFEMQMRSPLGQSICLFVTITSGGKLHANFIQKMKKQIKGEPHDRQKRIEFFMAYSFTWKNFALCFARNIVGTSNA